MARPSKGVRVQITTRLPPDVHRASVIEARRRGWNLNDFITVALRNSLDDLPPPIGERANVNIYDDDGNKIGVV